MGVDNYNDYNDNGPGQYNGYGTNKNKNIYGAGNKND